jgi:uncharacterized protein (TIGR02453 family)
VCESRDVATTSEQSPSREFGGFPDRGLELYAGLEADNSKSYWSDHKAVWESDVRDPMRALTAALADEFGEAKLFRPNRDIRFSKDKTPYKTHVGIYFRHARAAEMDTGGMYLHLEPGHVFMGAGIWHPGTPALKRIRDALVARPEGWRRALVAVEPVWKLADGEALKRPPAGYSADNPLIEDIKRKSFAITASLTQKQATSSGFLDEWAERAASARPFMEYLCSALGVEY